MLVISLSILFLYAVTVILNLEHQDEIHQLVAILSGFTALFFLFFLTPIMIKCLLVILIFPIINKIVFIYKN